MTVTTVVAMSDQTLSSSLYALAADLMRAPLDARTTEQVLAAPVEGRPQAVALLAAEFDFAGSGWGEEGHGPVSFLTRFVEGALGRGQADLALAARDLADGV